MKLNFSHIIHSLCPRCGQGKMFAKPLAFDFRPSCPVCNLDFSDHDTGDAAVYTQICLLSFTLIPMALVVELVYAPSLLFHMLFWGVIMFLITFGTLKPIKSFYFHIRYKTRPELWPDGEKSVNTEDKNGPAAKK